MYVDLSWTTAGRRRMRRSERANRGEREFVQAIAGGWQNIRSLVSCSERMMFVPEPPAPPLSSVVLQSTLHVHTGQKRERKFLVAYGRGARATDPHISWINITACDSRLLPISHQLGGICIARSLFQEKICRESVHLILRLPVHAISFSS